MLTPKVEVHSKQLISQVNFLDPENLLEISVASDKRVEMKITIGKVYKLYSSTEMAVFEISRVECTYLLIYVFTSHKFIEKSMLEEVQKLVNYSKNLVSFCAVLFPAGCLG